MSRTIASIFSPVDPKPVRQHLVQAKLDKVIFLPSTTNAAMTNSLQLIGIARTGEIYRFGDTVSSSAPKAVRAIDLATRAKPPSIWQEMFGKEVYLEDLESAASTIPPQRVRKVGRPSDVFEGPSHTMPPIGMLFDAFMDELLSARPAESKQDEPIAHEIVLEETDVPATAPILNVEDNRIRSITDEEVRDLEAFFRDVLETSWLPFQSLSTD